MTVVEEEDEDEVEGTGRNGLCVCCGGSVRGLIRDVKAHTLVSVNATTRHTNISIVVAILVIVVGVIVIILFLVVLIEARRILL